MNAVTKGTLCKEVSGDTAIYVKWDASKENLVTFNKIVIPSEGESQSSFRWEHAGHGLFIISDRLKEHFYNWDEFPALHDAAIVFLDADCSQELKHYDL